MFDGVHAGHRFLINRLKEEGEKRGLDSVVFTFASHPLEVVAPERVPPMLTTVSERCRLLEDAGVNQVQVLEFDSVMRKLTSREFLAEMHRRHNVDAFVVGFNNRFGSDRESSMEDYKRYGKEIGVEVFEAQECPDVSSSLIRSLLRNRKVVEANKALGYDYFIAGEVVPGKQLGRRLGFPTANVDVQDAKKLIPPVGVYASKVKVDGQCHAAMVNIGYRPTVDQTGAIATIETHILDFSGDLYGKQLRVEFVDYLREERRFESLDALTAQIRIDEQAVRARIANNK